MSFLSDLSNATKNAGNATLNAGNATLNAGNATKNAARTASMTASRTATNKASDATKKWESFGAEWKNKFDVYKYEDDELDHQLTDKPIKVRNLFGTHLDSTIIGVKIYGSGVPDATGMLDKMRSVLNPLAYVGAGSAATQAVTVAAVYGGGGKTGGIPDEFRIQKQAIDNSWIHHDAVLLTCQAAGGEKLFVTLEKMTHAIVIQIAEDEKTVREIIMMNHRENVFHIPFEIDDCKPNLRPRDVIQWLLENNEMGKMYNLLMDNCQHFAERLFNYVAFAKTYPSSTKTKEAIYESLKQKLLKTE